MTCNTGNVRQDKEARVEVLHVIARMNVGGPAVEIVELIHGLDSNEFSQTLVCGYCGPDESDYLEGQSDTFPVVRLQGLGRRLNVWSDIKVLIRLRKIIQTVSPDIVHTHTAKAGVLGRLALRISGVRAKSIHTYHGHLLHGYFGKIKTKIMIWIERALARSTDTLICVGLQVKTDLLSVGVGREHQFCVIRSGVPEKNYPSRMDARRELGISPQAQVVTYVGRLTQIKRIDRLLQVTSLAQERIPDFQLLIVGGGELSPWVETEIKSRFLRATMVGWQGDTSLYLAATDLIILTSDNEGTPLVLIEAGQAARPAVATNVGSVSEIILHEETGFLTNLSVPTIAEAVTQALTHFDLKTVGAAAQRHIRSKFSLESFINGHADVYRTGVRLFE